MADEEDGRAAGGNSADRLEQLRDGRCWQRRRGLVEHQHAFAVGHLLGSADEADQRPLGLRHVTDWQVGVEIEPHRLEQAPHAPTFASPQQTAVPGRLVAAETKVLEHAHAFGKARLLMQEREPVALRLTRPERQPDARSVHLHRARIGRVVAGENLDQGRLARAVLADEGMDLAGQDGQIDAGESLRAAEALGEPAHLEEGAGPRRSGSLCCGRLYAAVRHFFRPQSFA